MNGTAIKYFSLYKFNLKDYYFCCFPAVHLKQSDIYEQNNVAEMNEMAAKYIPLHKFIAKCYNFYYKNDIFSCFKWSDLFEWWNEQSMKIFPGDVCKMGLQTESTWTFK